MSHRFSFGSGRQSIESIDENSRTTPPYTSAADDGPSSSNSMAPKVSVSVYIREVVSGTCTLFQEMPGVSMVCKTLLSIEKLVGTAKGNKKELAVLLELCDVVMRGALDRWSEHPGPYEGLEALRRHVTSAHRVAAMCNKGRLSRFALSRKISRNIVTVKTNIVNFATLHNLVLSTALHTKLAKMEAALAAKERERQEAEEAARRQADAEEASNEKKQRGVIAVMRRIGAASNRALGVRSWYSARQGSARLKSSDQLGSTRRRQLMIVGGVVLVVVCGRHALLRHKR